LDDYFSIGHRGCCYDCYRKEYGGYDSHYNMKDHRPCSKHDSCRNKKLVKDWISVDWSVPNGNTQTVYYSHSIDELVASGFISYDCGSSDYIIVNFFLGDREVEEPIRIYRDSNVAFTANGFNCIRIHCPQNNETLDSECPDTCEGEISIIPRYFV
jgi:hypothetical protein